jgi:cell division protein FtsB
MRQKWTHSFFFGASILLLVYICAIGINNIFRYNAFYSEYDALKLTLLTETRVNETYKRQLSQLDNAALWELEAKTKLGYVKEGEVIYKIIPKTDRKK